MTKLAMAIGGVLILGSAWVAIFPEALLSIVDFESRTFIYLAALARFTMGLVLILGASGSRFPTPLRILGGLMVLGGLVLPFIPTDFLVGVVGWAAKHLTFYRVAGSAAGMLLGGFIAYAGLPERAAA